jgi:hypothetical protein
LLKNYLNLKYEISTIRREDYQKVAAKSEYEDLTQASNNPSTQDSRGTFIKYYLCIVLLYFILIFKL